MKSAVRDAPEAHVKDLLRQMERRGFASGPFLTEEEQSLCRALLQKEQKLRAFEFAFYGGAPGAERAAAVVCEGRGKEPSRDLSKIAVLRFETAADELPDHRTVLGSLMGLGLERTVIGDIFLCGDRMAAAVKEQIAPYVENELTRMGRTSVRALRIDLPEGFVIERRMKEMTVTVPGARLDCFVAEICRLSRDDAAGYIKSGQACVDHAVCTAPDKKLLPGQLLSLRGAGRFRIGENCGFTKSGRSKYKILQYV